MTKRWSKRVDEGVRMIYAFMSNERDCRVMSMIECITGRPNCRCEQCRAYDALCEGLEWLGDQIDKHH